MLSPLTRDSFWLLWQTDVACDSLAYLSDAMSVFARHGGAGWKAERKSAAADEPTNEICDVE